MFGLLNTSQIYGIEHDQRRSPKPTATATITTSSIPTASNNANATKVKPHRRTTSCVSETSKENKFFASLSSLQQGIRSPTNFLEKFLKSDLLSGYDTLRNNNNNNHSTSTSSFYANLSPTVPAKSPVPSTAAASAEGLLNTFNCLQGNYRASPPGGDSDIYEVVNVVRTHTTPASSSTTPRRVTIGSANEMTIKYSKNLLPEPTQPQSPATLQNYQKIPDFTHDQARNGHGTSGMMMTASASSSSAGNSSGASSGEFNQQHGTATIATGNLTTTPIMERETGSGLSSAASNLYKKLSFGSRSSKNMDVTPTPTNEVASDNSTSSISTNTTTTSNSSNSKSKKSVDLQRTSSASSSGDCVPTKTVGSGNGAANNPTATLSPERVQRRKLLQMISNYDQQNKVLQRELAKEKRRRSEELACVVKSLLCFESKLKTDMKAVNLRLVEKDVEICRLVQQNRMMRQRLLQLQRAERESARDEGVVEDGGEECEDQEEVGDVDIDCRKKKEIDDDLDDEKLLLIDCLVPEALQCFNCRRQFYDIETKTDGDRTLATLSAGGAKDGHATSTGNRKKDDHSKGGTTTTTEHGCSSSDDTTVSSSFYGARRSVRYTSKRTSGTFRDYMRSRAMHIDADDDRDDCEDYEDYDERAKHSEENTSTISREDSQTTSSYEKINVYSRTIERMHGLKGENERDVVMTRPGSRQSTGSSSNRSNSLGSKMPNTANEDDDDDDGIFSPTQDDDDFEEEMIKRPPPAGRTGTLKIVARRSTEFSEASPQQVYETSTDDWYASASDVEDLGGGSSTANNSKSYGHQRMPTAASSSTHSSSSVNPVLECVNQILLQQSMEECERRLNVAAKTTTATTKNTNKSQQQKQIITSPKIPNTMTTSHHTVQPPTTPSAANLPRRSSLSDRRNPRNANNGTIALPATGSDAEGVGSRNGTLTRKRVHFSTKNSMVHVPRNDDISDEDEADEMDDAVVELRHHQHATDGHDPMISRRQQQQQQHNHHPQSPQLYYPMNYGPSSPQVSANNNTGQQHQATPKRLIECDARLDTLNYESVYSNAYEPIGSERNSSSNLYVDMEAANSKLGTNTLSGMGGGRGSTSKGAPTVAMSPTIGRDQKLLTKMPPALPPKPANLLKFRKSLQQLDEVPDETIDCGASTITTEPDYCSIADVVTSVQIVADVHKAPTTASSSSEADGELPARSKHLPDTPLQATLLGSDYDQNRMSVEVEEEEEDDDDACAASQKTDELEEIFADIPKLPNVAAIIAPKNAKHPAPLVLLSPKQADYLTMTPKMLSPAGIAITAPGSGRKLLPSGLTATVGKNVTPLKLQLNVTPMSAQSQQQYKRKHVPNILAEINKRMSLPNSPTTPTKPSPPTAMMLTTTSGTSMAKSIKSMHSPNKLLKKFEDTLTPSLPLEAEFDWYNLDAEYGRAPAPHHGGGGGSVVDSLNGSKMLAEIHEEHHESLSSTMNADEYNLDEEFSLHNEKTYDEMMLAAAVDKQMSTIAPELSKLETKHMRNTVSFPTSTVYSENSPLVPEIINSTILSNNTNSISGSNTNNKAKRIKKNLANFDKFIEGSGLSTKPLPSRRKIYFAGPV